MLIALLTHKSTTNRPLHILQREKHFCARAVKENEIKNIYINGAYVLIVLLIHRCTTNQPLQVLHRKKHLCVRLAEED